MTALLVLIALVVDVSVAKLGKCKTRFNGNSKQWSYCTKFGSAANSSTFVKFKSRIKNWNTMRP